MFTAQRIRDPLHNLIEFRANQFENALWGVIQTRPFQRLRRIRQLGFSDLVYPGATHSRFAHSLGVFHTARRLMWIIREHLGETKYRETLAHQALAASLVHDIGHGPFSHAFEDVGRRLKLKMADHEIVSDVLIRSGEVADALNLMGSGFANDVANIITKAGPGDLYSAVVSSQFDADRLDYMRRDRLMTGTEHGAIDFDWLVANLEIGNVPSGVDEASLGNLETFVLGPKAVYAAETYVLALFQLYPTVYFHKTTRGAEKLFSEILVRVFQLVRNGSAKNTGLPLKHPLIRFAKMPEAVDSALDVHDSVIWGALNLLANAKDAIVQGFAIRLRDRRLYKAVDVREEVTKKLGPAASANGSTALDRICASIREKISEQVAEQDDVSPRILPDETVREPYKEFQESKGPLNQIMIRTRSGELVDLGERSKVVRAIEPYRVYRLYVGEDDDKTRKFLDEIIESEVRHDDNF